MSASAPVRRFDPRALPRAVTHGRSTTYCGVLLLVLIEGIVVLSLVTTYFYLAVVRGAAFPRGGGEPPDPTLSSIALGVSLAGAVVAHLAEHAARAAEPAWMRLLLGIAAALGAGYVALSAVDLASASHSWTSHAYGSIVWTTVGYQATHALAATLATAVMLGVSFRRSLLGERRSPMQSLRHYWTFVVASGALVFFTLYVSPHLG